MSHDVNIAVIALRPTAKLHAKNIAIHLNLSLISTITNQDYVITVNDNIIALQSCLEKKTQPYFVDFSNAKMTYRRQHASRKNEMILRAIGVKAENCHVLDATAGLGQDSFIMANGGYQVTMIEQSPIVATLLENGLDRAKKIPDLQKIMARITLHNSSTQQFLKDHPNPQPDVIYLDPMFPLRTKDARVKKEMFFLQEILEHNSTHDDVLLTLALQHAKKRVIVKRPRKAPPLSDNAAPHILEGKAHRFDIYYC